MSTFNQYWWHVPCFYVKYDLVSVGLRFGVGACISGGSANITAYSSVLKAKLPNFFTANISGYAVVPL